MTCDAGAAPLWSFAEEIMRSRFEVIPGKSLGPVSLGMSRDTVRTVLGTPSYVEAAYERWGISFPDKDCYSDAALQIRYTATGQVEDIQASLHDDFTILFDGCDVHASEVETIAAVISRRGTLDRSAKEFPRTYWFPSLGVALWRQRSDSTHFDTINLTIPEKKNEANEALLRTPMSVMRPADAGAADP